MLNRAGIPVMAHIGFTPCFVKQYADVHSVLTKAAMDYAADVADGTFPDRNTPSRRLINYQGHNMTRLAESQGFMGPFSRDGKAGAAPCPTHLGRGRRYSLAMTNRCNHLLRDYRSADQHQNLQEK